MNARRAAAAAVRFPVVVFERLRYAVEWTFNEHPVFAFATLCAYVMFVVGVVSGWRP